MTDGTLGLLVHTLLGFLSVQSYTECLGKSQFLHEELELCTF